MTHADTRWTLGAVVACALVAPAGASAQSGECVCDLAPVMGKVSSVKNGRVAIDLGTAHGLEVGDHVGVVSCCDAPWHPDHLTAWICPDDKAVTAVVELDEVGESSASGEVGRGSAAHKGDLVFVTDRPATHKVAFPGFSHQWLSVVDLSLRLRAIPGMSGGGVGFPFDLSISYQTPWPLEMGIFSAPSFLGMDGGNVVGHAIMGGFVAYSTRFFEVGLGVGGHVDSLGPERNLAVVQSTRLGATDGLALSLQNTFILGFDTDGEGRGLHWDSVQAEIRIPVHWRVTLFVEGGGGGNFSNMLWFRMTTGVNIMLRGKGGPGTIVLPLGIGGGFYELWDDDCNWETGSCEDTFFASVIAVTGLDIRF